MTRGDGGLDDAERAAMASAPWAALVRHGRGDLAEAEAAALREWARGDAAREALLAGVERL
ncbi:MAG TPA: hypothetical protein VNK43_12480, partial [Gemmatimonadales bacterium]|nr:hypothetical protein [Gemmatimonadales bacterium]